MADIATARGVLLPGETRWNAYTRKDGTAGQAGSRPICHVYDAETQNLVGPIDVPIALRENFGTVATFAQVDISYKLFPKGNGRAGTDRVLDSISSGK